MKRQFTMADIDHGTITGHKQHRENEVPFPEDQGGEECGCREAWAIYQAQYRKGKGGQYQKRYAKARSRALNRLRKRFPAEYKTYLDLEMEELKKEEA